MKNWQWGHKCFGCNGTFSKYMIFGAEYAIYNANTFELYDLCDFCFNEAYK